VHVLRNDKPNDVLEFTGVFDTPAMISIIQDRLQGHAIYIYPAGIVRIASLRNTMPTKPFNVRPVALK